VPAQDAVGRVPAVPPLPHLGMVMNPVEQASAVLVDKQSVQQQVTEVALQVWCARCALVQGALHRRGAGKHSAAGQAVSARSSGSPRRILQVRYAHCGLVQGAPHKVAQVWGGPTMHNLSKPDSWRCAACRCRGVLRSAAARSCCSTVRACALWRLCG